MVELKFISYLRILPEYIKNFVGPENFKMIFLVILLSLELSDAFNQNLSSVHYSIVTPGIDDEIQAGISNA